MKNFNITNLRSFRGYINKHDITNIGDNFLVEGSQNVLSTDDGRIKIREGYTLDGAANSNPTPIESSFDWTTHRGVTLNLRSYDDELEVRFDAGGGLGPQWYRVEDGWSSVTFRYDTFWDSGEAQDILLFVNGNSNIYSWSGGIATVDITGSTSNTLKKQGTTTWAEEGFLFTGTRQVVIGGTTYTYTGGEDTTILTGVTPDPTAGGHSDGDVVVQKVRTATNTPAGGSTYTAATISFQTGNPDKINDSANGFLTAGFKSGQRITVQGSASNDGNYTISKATAGSLELSDQDELTTETAGATVTITNPEFTNDLIAVLENQVWIGSENKRDVYKSKVDTFTNYSFSVPRRLGQGAVLTLDSAPTGFVVQEQDLYISGQRDEWYRSNFELSGDLQNETLTIKRLKTATLQAATNQESIFKIKNDVIFLSQEPTIDSLGRIEDVDTTQSQDISDPIKKLLDSLDRTNASGIFFRNNFYIGLPAESTVLVFNIERGHWEAPLTLPIARFAIIDGELYAHSNSVPETYKLFDGVSDNGNPIEARATFAYRNYGNRHHKKHFNEWLTEGYMSENTVLNLEIKYDYLGSRGVRSFTINGDGSQNSNILFKSSDDGSLGKKSLGKASFGGKEGEALLPTDLNKFRAIQETTNNNFYEMQVSYSSNEEDYRWELLAFGGNVKLATADNNEIKL